MDREDIIRKSDAIKAVIGWETDPTDEELESALADIPAVEPWELYDPDEWCQDCKEYDTENHRCPRWNRVIHRTLNEMEGEWVEDEGQNTLLKDFIDKGEVWRVCSICGTGHKIAEKKGSEIFTTFISDFCPGCGAKMKGESNEAD